MVVFYTSTILFEELFLYAILLWSHFVAVFMLLLKSCKNLKMLCAASFKESEYSHM